MSPHFKLDYDKIYLAPIPCKIMGIIILKNFAYGLYKGIKNFKKSERPVTQLYDNVFSYTIWGFAEAIIWPITFPYTITYEFDKLANYAMGKPIRSDNN